MVKTMKSELAARMRAESEMTRDDDCAPTTRATRPDLAKVCSVRLTEQERARVETAATARHLSVSTLVRSWILDRLDAERIA